VTADEVLLSWPTAWPPLAVAKLKARVANSSPTLGKKIEAPFGKLPTTITFTGDAGLGKREEFHNVVGLQLAHVEITWKGLPVEIASCVKGKTYTLKYKDLSKEVKERISDRVFKTAILGDSETEWYRMRRESLNQDLEDLQSLYHIRSSYYMEGVRVTEASQIYPDCKILRLFQSGGKGGSKGFVHRQYQEPSEFEERYMHEASSELVPPVELETKSSEEDGVINFQDGYRRFRTRFNASPSVHQLAQRMESFLGRYINPENITVLVERSNRSNIHRIPSLRAELKDCRIVEISVVSKAQSF
jgi:hypothetical protein